MRQALTLLLTVAILTGCGLSPLGRPTWESLDPAAQAKWKTDTEACGGDPNDVVAMTAFGGVLAGLVMQVVQQEVRDCLRGRGWERFPAPEPNPVLLKRQ